MLRIDLGLDNQNLYAGCEIEEVGGRKNLKTPPSVAANTVGQNVARIIRGSTEREVTLTGAMAVWAYLVCFHHVVHRFDRVYYEDGRNPPLLVAAHG